MIVIILNIKDKILIRRIKYTFNQIMLYLGYEYEIKNHLNENVTKNKKYSLLIYYNDKPLNFKNKKSIQIISDKKGKNKCQEKLYYFKDKNSVVFYYDFVLESFNILARDEEIHSRNIDKHQRFIAEKSKIFEYLKEPIVNKHILILDKLIKKLHNIDNTPLIQKCHWPKNKEFAICLTHDVDIVKFKKSDIFNLNKIMDFIKGTNPYWQFEKIIKLEKGYNFKSTFFFCTEKKHNFDPNYSLKEKRIVNVIKFIVKEGYEIGLHLSYLSYDNEKMMETEKRELNNIIDDKIGVRTHFLRFRVPNTWVFEDKSGFYYDSSLGYSNHTGYRSGFCWPYNPYAISSEKELRLFELPLSVMDSALFEEHKTPKDAFNALKKMFQNVQKFNGVIVMNWHQRVFNEKYFNGWSFVYEKCLDYFQEKKAFVGPARDIIEWIVKRNFVVVSDMANQNLLKFRLTSKVEVNDFALKLIYGKNIKLKIYNSKDFQIIKNKEGFIIQFKKIKKNQSIILEFLN